jgi:hypothetical protein
VRKLKIIRLEPLRQAIPKKQRTAARNSEARRG